jgi:hypothetical protein
LKLLPGPHQSFSLRLLLLQSPPQLLELLQQGQQQVAAPLGMEPIEGQQGAAAVGGTGGRRLAQPFAHQLPDAIGAALPQGEADAALAGPRRRVQRGDERARGRLVGGLARRVVEALQQRLRGAKPANAGARKEQSGAERGAWPRADAALERGAGWGAADKAWKQPTERRSGGGWFF